VLDLTVECFDDLSRRNGRPLDPRPDRERALVRFRHIPTTDPGGCWAVDDEHGLAAASMATLREGIWGLSLLVVAPRAQSNGLGRAVLARTLEYGAPHRGGLILSSEDPRAIRAYARAGFDLHPAVKASGSPRELRLAPEIREGSAEDAGGTAAVDRHTRGGARVQDVAALIAAGSRLLLHPGRGYVAVSDGVVRTLSALDDEAAYELLAAAIATTPPGGSAGVDLITAGQDWAVRAALDAGLAIEPWGPLFARGRTGTLRPFIPSGAYL